jgi:hypothetical protein
VRKNDYKNALKYKKKLQHWQRFEKFEKNLNFGNQNFDTENTILLSNSPRSAVTTLQQGQLDRRSSMGMISPGIFSNASDGAPASGFLDDNFVTKKKGKKIKNLQNFDFEKFSHFGKLFNFGQKNSHFGQTSQQNNVGMLSPTNTSFSTHSYAQTPSSSSFDESFENFGNFDHNNQNNQNNPNSTQFNQINSPGYQDALNSLQTDQPRISLLSIPDDEYLVEKK